MIAHDDIRIGDRFSYGVQGEPNSCTFEITAEHEEFLEYRTDTKPDEVFSRSKASMQRFVESGTYHRLLPVIGVGQRYFYPEHDTREYFTIIRVEEYEEKIIYRWKEDGDNHLQNYTIPLDVFHQTLRDGHIKLYTPPPAPAPPRSPFTSVKRSIQL